MKIIVTVALVLSLAFPLGGHAVDIDGHALPDTLDRFGARFTLRSCGVREFLFSDIYLLGLYLPDSLSGTSGVFDNDRIFLLKVLYKGDLPEELPDLWREPLADQLSREYLAILQDLYDRVDNGDTVEFGYHRGSPEVLRINGEVVARESEVQLVPALTSLWLGDEPVSGNLKRLLLNSECR